MLRYCSKGSSSGTVQHSPGREVDIALEHLLSSCQIGRSGPGIGRRETAESHGVVVVWGRQPLGRRSMEFSPMEGVQISLRRTLLSYYFTFSLMLIRDLGRSDEKNRVTGLMKGRLEINGLKGAKAWMI